MSKKEMYCPICALGEMKPMKDLLTDSQISVWMCDVCDAILIDPKYERQVNFFISETKRTITFQKGEI